MSKVKAAIAAILSYLVANPGAVSLIVGEGVLVFAKLGLNLSVNTVYALGAVLVPLLLAYFHVASKANAPAVAARSAARKAKLEAGKSVVEVAVPEAAPEA